MEFQTLEQESIFPRNVTNRAQYLILTLIKGSNAGSETYVAVPIKTFCRLASVTTEIVVENMATKPNTVQNMVCLFMGNKNRKHTGRRTIATAAKTESSLAPVARRLLE